MNLLRKNARVLLKQYCGVFISRKPILILLPSAFAVGIRTTFEKLLDNNFLLPFIGMAPYFMVS